MSETARDRARLATCTECGIANNYHTISCPVPSGEISDQGLRAIWRNAGGSFHGPNVETGTMPEAKLLPLLRRLMRRTATND